MNSIAALQTLAAKYGLELEATSPEEAAAELYRKVPALARQKRAAKRDFVRKGDPRGLDVDPGNESAWDIR
jgi:hypothetical protein